MSWKNHLRNIFRTLTALSASLVSAKVPAQVKFKKYRVAPDRTYPKRLGISSKNEGFVPVLPIFSHFKPGASLKERVSQSVQKIEGAVIRGTWLKTVFNQEREAVFEAGQVFEDLPKELPNVVRGFRGTEAEVREKLLFKIPQFRSASRYFPSEVELIYEGGEFRPYWVIEFVSQDETQLYRLRADESGNLKEFKTIGDRLAEPVGSVFPKGPTHSHLTDVAFGGLDRSGKLSSEKVIVDSAQKAVYSPQGDFRFQPDAAEFDAVQAYFYANQILGWFRDRFEAQPFHRLDIRVQVGEKSNAAFYYKGIVRLGSGDGKKYENMARDPSIVMHEVAHSIVDRYAGLKPEGESSALNEGFADYFAAAMLENPRIGDSAYLEGEYLRSVANDAMAPHDLKGGTYKASLVVSGTLWEIRTRINSHVADTLAFRVLSRLHPEAKFSDFYVAYEAAIDFLSDGDRSIADGVFARRGWKELVNELAATDVNL